MWGLAFSAVTIGASLLTRKDGSISNGSRDESSLALMWRKAGDRTFLSGMVLGLGISLLYSSLLKEFRLWERTRLLWNDWWTFDDKARAPFRTPQQISATPHILTDSRTGKIQLILSPAIAATSTLHISLLTLQSGCEISSCHAPSVEFYYVVSGSGLFSQQGIIETATLTAGDGFVVDPGSMRWIANKNSEPLVLMRAADGGDRYSRRNLDVIRMDPNRKSSTMEMLQGGYDKMKVLAKDYVAKSEEASSSSS